ncbi:acetyl-CoA synthetase-like protein [Coniochaeta ligniaria NRRL 30616]|uniref:Acetyl-CoA synthetase-like protein n=1 Tax=Coniochaeta ligniaria NRRL 30616 TaxID=1408157 RepID=A0A1J7JN02_9PEZI|nr:acetyl-CoA synthetase-like protein [Coniochaeta ligniaria NRRL 30616]
MVFIPPQWVPDLPFSPPDNVSLCDFMYNDDGHRPQPLDKCRNPFTCGLSGRTYTTVQAKDRVESLARSLSAATGWTPDDGTEWEKMACIFSSNAVDYLTVAHAVHRLNGILTPANTAYSAAELEHQLRATHATVIFTCVSLLSVAIQAAKAAGIPRERIFLVYVPETDTESKRPAHQDLVTVESLVARGRLLPALQPLKWTKGQGARQTAFVSFSSGTSGLPKGVMISHYNVISNCMQITAYESVARAKQNVTTQVAIGVLPFSHIYGLVAIAHLSMWRGDEVIVLPKYSLLGMMSAVQKYKVNQLFLVPPIAIQIVNNSEKCRQFDLSSVRSMTSGAAPLGLESIEQIRALWPKWNIGQGYGLTESSTAICGTSEHDAMPGTSGSLMPWTRCKVIDANGNEVTEYDTPGELYAQSPSICLGYLDNTRATAETFVWLDDGRYLRTGDEVVVRKSPQGNEHIMIVDRIKELIKVKGQQIAPAELEACLLAHPFVADCAVIAVSHGYTGESPKAFVVKSAAGKSVSDADAIEALKKHIADNKASYKQLHGGIEFIDVIPKSPSGKILRRLLRDAERAKTKKTGPKI